MNLGLSGLLQIGGHGGKHRLIGQLAQGRIPIFQRNNRPRQCFADDLILDRTKQHICNWCDKRHQNKNQKRCNQRKRPQFLAPERTFKAAL